MAHPWAALSAAVLALCGLVIGAAGVVVALSGTQSWGSTADVSAAMLAFGLLLLAAGALHFCAAVLIVQGRESGRRLGFAIGGLGLLVGGLGLVVAVRGWLDPPPGNPGVDITGALLPLPYLVVVLGLVMDGRSSRRRAWTAGGDPAVPTPGVRSDAIAPPEPGPGDASGGPDEQPQ